MAALNSKYRLFLRTYGNITGILAPSRSYLPETTSARLGLNMLIIAFKRFIFKGFVSP